MKHYMKNYMTPISCAMMLATWTTFGQVVGGSVTVNVPGVAITAPGVAVTVGGGAVVVPDNYVYYPAYGVYYSSSRRQYAYMDGNAWVSRPAPAGVSIDVLRASPSINMDFHDSPALHHKEMVQKYPRAWKPAASDGSHRPNASDRGQKQVRENEKRSEHGEK